jgi:hypothetical protein
MVNPNSLKNLRKGGGRKGQPNKCTQVKDEFFQAYFKLGGLKNLLKLFADKKFCSACKTLYPANHKEKFCTCGQLLVVISGETTQKQFLFGVLPQLMPKKTDIDGKGINVIILEALRIDKGPKAGLGDDA